MDCNRCQGTCCWTFVIGNHTMGSLRKFAGEHPDDEQLLYILDMLVVVTESPNGDYFTCKYWDQDTRRCREYERRPDMCRDYPYGGHCERCLQGIAEGAD